MDTTRLFKAVFNRKFIKYFLLTLAVFMLACFVSFYCNYIDDFIESRVSFGSQIKFFVLFSGWMLPYNISTSLCMAAFLAYRNLAEGTRLTNFFKVWAIGSALALVLAAGIYSYDRSVTPVLKAQSSEMLFMFRTRGYASRIGTGSGFKDISPSTSSPGALSNRIDSLSRQADLLAEECTRLLSQLPEDAARTAYDYYEFEYLKVPYNHAESAVVTEEEINYRVLPDLSNLADKLYGTTSELSRERLEYILRFANAASMIIGFMVFAALGFFLRKRSIKTILVIVGILLLIHALFSTISGQTQRIMKEQNKARRHYEMSLRR